MRDPFEERPYVPEERGHPREFAQCGGECCARTIYHDPIRSPSGGMSTVVRWYAETPTLGMPVPSGEGSEAVPVPLSGEAMPPYEIQDRATLCGLPALCGRGTRPLGQRSARRAANPDPVRCRGCGLPRTPSSRHLGSLAVVPELSLTLWLLIRGVEVPQQEKEGLSSPLPRH